MALDIAVLQEKYGANMNYAMGDNIIKGFAGGADVFVCTKVNDVNTIKDFATGVDHIDLAALGAEFQIKMQGNSYAIQLDLNGDGQFDHGLILSVHEVTFADISM